MTRAIVLAAIAAASLAAGSGQAQPRGGQPPPGDYFQTCRNVSTFGFGRDATMTAECRDDFGRWRQTSVRFAGCDRIENRNGVLSCRPAPGYPSPGPGPGPGPGPIGPGPIGPGPGPGPGGPGMGRPALTLFSAPNFGGRPFTAEREITNLPREYNDRAMSLRIDGRRPWMVCTDSDFRGRCQVFDHDVADLRQFGLAGKISSMRPVR
jgi:Beta/Gamma crystallin